MPAIGAAVAAAAFNAGIIGSSIWGFYLVSGATVLALSAAATFAISYVGNTLFKAKVPDVGSVSLASERSQMVRQAITTRKIVYGKVKISGAITFINVSSDNKWLYMLVTLTGHQIEAIDKVYFGDSELELYRASSWSKGSYATGAYVRVGATYYQRTSTAYPTELVPVSNDPDTGETFYETRTVNNQSPETAPTLWSVVSDPTAIGPLSYVGGDYAGYARVWTGLGTTAGDADLLAQMRADVPSLWTTDHKQSGCAKIYVRLQWNSDVYASGIPNVSVLMRGKNDIYDPRTETTGYTDNWALCTADYLATPRTDGGIGSEWADINEDDLIASANVCDEDVTLADATTEKRYLCNGSIDTNDSPKTIIEGLLTAGAGSVVWSGGSWCVLSGYWRTPEADPISEGMMTGAIRVQTRRSRSDLYNAVRGTYMSPDNSWQESDLPTLESDAFKAEDNGEAVYADIAYPFTTSTTAGQRLMKIALLRCRQQIAVTVPCNLKAMRYRAGDVVPLSKPNFGWVDKPFEVTSWALAQRDDGSLGIDLSMQETASSVWDWNSSEEQTVDPAPDTNLPKPWTIYPPRNPVLSSGESALLINRDKSLTLRIRASWEPSITATVSQYEAQFAVAGTDVWVPVPPVGAEETSIYCYPVNQGTAYDVRIRARNSIGARSEWATVSNHVVVGLADPPADVEGLRISVVGDIASLSWSASNVVDPSHYRVRFSQETVGAEWANASDLQSHVDATSVQVPAMVGTYLVKAVDLSGNESENAALVISTTAGLTVLNAVESLQCAPAWSGTLTDVSVVDGALRLAYARDIFEDEDWFGPAGWFLGSEGFVSEGSFVYGTDTDLGEVCTARVTASLAVVGVNEAAADFFSLSDVFSQADWFGVSASQFGVAVDIATSLDGVTFGDWQEFVVGDYTARGWRFRIRLSSSQFGLTPVVSSFGVTLTMPVRNEAGNDIECPAGGVTVTFDHAYRGLLGIAFNDQEMEPGDVAVTVSKSASGFTRKYLDSTGADVARSFDFVASGYGRVAA